MLCTKAKKETNRAALGTYIRRTYGQGSCRYYWTTSTFKTRHSYILVISDHFTKWTEAIAIPNQESTTICKAFVDNFITKYGTPLQIHSDQGRNFQSDTFKGMCSVLGIDKTRTTSFRPQSNGGVERFDRKLASMLAMYCQKNQETWGKLYAASDDGISIIGTCSRTPNSMQPLPIQALIPQPREINVYQGTSYDYMDHLNNKLEQNHAIARKSLKWSHIIRK